MATSTPSTTPEVAPVKKYDSPFNSKSVLITVGRNRKLFSIHEAKLATTKFFEIHNQDMLTEHTQVPNNLAQYSHTISRHQDVKLEDGTSENSRMVKADYHIEDRFFLEPAAFNILAKFLYNEPPERPSSSQELKTLFRAYGIAVKYKCYALQNKIVDCVRQYYGRVKITLDDLTWCANRFGDSIKCPLNAYLVEQIAFEIADKGFEEFCRSNAYMKSFLEQGDKLIRYHLFATIARHGSNTSIGDPSAGRAKFVVYEKGELAGQLKI